MDVFIRLHGVSDIFTSPPDNTVRTFFRICVRRQGTGRPDLALLMLLPLLTLPRLASISDCSVIDPYDCVARLGCGW